MGAALGASTPGVSRARGGMCSCACKYYQYCCNLCVTPSVSPPPMHDGSVLWWSPGVGVGYLCW